MQARFPPSPRGQILLGVGLALLAPQTAGGQRADETPLTDVLEVLVLDGQLLAIDARGGGQTALRLHLDEEVAWLGTRGAVGVALTTQRILAVAQGDAIWRALRYERTESVSGDVLLGDRVALILTTNRVIGFSVATADLVTERLGVREKIVTRAVGENTAVIVTDRRALGLSPAGGSFVAVPLHLTERIDSVVARSNLATITTNRRLLTFRSPTGAWEARRLELHPR